MKYFTREGREVDVTDIEYGRGPEDTFIGCAYYMDIEDPDKAIVPAHVCDELTEDYAGHLEELWHEHKVCEAEYAYEGER